ncbi:cytochrome P450 2J4-like [Brachionichthys hirsutus]|uniref:cytochrome P450 2J4-like n=1 Tax=Brachionichthys hirsutus TaxID=412623 RepID=UPI003604C97F
MIFHTLFECLDVTSWLLISFVVLLLADVVKNWAPTNFPHGPLGVPFLGNVFTGSNLKSLEKVAELYGPVFSLRSGSRRTVFIAGPKMVKEALVTHLDDIIDRPHIPLFYVTFKGIGVTLSNGYMWKSHRKFISSHLRYFGGGPKSVENNIQVESSFLCEALKDEQGKPFNPKFIITNAVGNIICSVLFGHRFEYNDQNYTECLKMDSAAFHLSGSIPSELYNAFPGLMEYLPGSHQTVLSNYRKIMAFLEGEVEKNLETRNPDDPRNYIDAYLSEIEKTKEDPQSPFTNDALLVSILDLIEAATESPTTVLRWGIIFMLYHPEIQAQAQAEIDRVIGQSRQANLSDRPKLPFTDAVVHEILRMGNILPVGFPKMASKDTTMGGFFIPKGTPINIMLGTVLYDKNEWETPDVFNPQHFLDSKGQFRKRDAFLPFSAGKRACLGENMARMEVFLFFTSILQRFTLSPVPGEMPSLEGMLGFTYTPQQFRVVAAPR